MNRFRPYLIGAVLGVLALALVPLAGLPRHNAGGGSGLTGWYFWMASRQAVTLRSVFLAVPPLDDPAMVRRAAGHYELVCTTCHGSPAALPEQMAEDMIPRPPRLTEAADRWRPSARIFQTVKYGIRHTAMPAWPSDIRDDEVWDMVALVRIMPTLSSGEYLAMAGEAGNCADCHGQSGEGRDGIPRLDILSPGYIAATMHAYRDGTRASGTMIAVARMLSDEQIDAAAERFGNDEQVPALSANTTDGPLRLLLDGDPLRDIPACLSCHNSGDPETYPALLGQDATYLHTQLELLSEKEIDRGGPHVDMMRQIAQQLREDEIAALSEWLAEQR